MHYPIGYVQSTVVQTEALKLCSAVTCIKVKRHQRSALKNEFSEMPLFWTTEDIAEFPRTRCMGTSSGQIAY